MADIYQITLPSGTTYLLKDLQARTDIEELKSIVSGGVSFLGITTTVLTDGATTKTVVIDGQFVTAKNGSLVIYDTDEFIWSDISNSWHLLGSSGSLGSLAFKNSATGSFTPSGTISQPTTTVTLAEDTVNSVSSVGTLADWSATVTNETLSFSFTQGSLPTTAQKTVATGVSSVTTSTPTFTGTSDTVTVS